jgi:Stress responsive A/B Barrel Domain
MMHVRGRRRKPEAAGNPRPSLPGPGTPAEARYPRGLGAKEAVPMIVHMVLLRIRRNVPMREIERVFQALGGLQRKIPGITGFSWGPNNSPTGLHHGFTHGFCMGFRDAAARDAYLPHPEHERVRAQIGSVLEGGLDAVLEFDYAA